MEILIQIIGFLAWIIITISYWQKKKRRLILMQMLAHILYATHFYMLNGMSGVFCNVVGILVLILLYIKEKIKRPCKFLPPLMCLMYLITIIFTYDEIFSICPIIASIIQLSTIYIKNMKTTKIGGILAGLCWLIYGISVLSYSSIITEIILIISILISLKRKRV